MLNVDSNPFKYLQRSSKELYERLFVKDSFIQHFSFTFSGNLLNLATQLAISPILARIYSPDAYGIFAIFNALLLNYSLVISGAYTQAILKPKKNEEILKVVRLAILMSLGLCVGTLIILPFFYEGLGHSLGLQSFEWLLFMLPPLALFHNINVSLSSLNVIFKKVLVDTKIVTSTNIFNRGFNLVFGWLSKGSTIGLVYGDTINKVFRLAMLAMVNKKVLPSIFKAPGLWETAVRYKSYPFYILPSSFVNLLSAQLPLYAFTFVFNPTLVGYMSFAITFLQLPVLLFGNASSTIFYRKASDAFHNGGRSGLLHITWKMFWRLFTLALLCYGVILPFAIPLFEWVFGERWATAGQYFSYLGLFYIPLLVSTPLNNVFSVVSKEKLLLVINVTGLVVRLGGLIPGLILGDPLIAIQIFSLASLLYYIVLCSTIIKLLNGAYLKLAFGSLAIICSVALYSYFVQNV